MVALAMAIIPGISMAATLHVGPNQTYKTITSAVNAAGTGDTILVDAGTYNEAFSVNKPLTLEASSGTKPLITQWPSSTYYGITINAPNVVVNGFKIVGAGANHGCIQVYGVANVRIENVDMSNGEYGVDVESSPNTTIASSTVTNCGYSGDTGGIFFKDSDKGNIIDSTVTGGMMAIPFSNSPHGVLTNVTVSDASQNGIYLCKNSYNATISECTVTNATDGIHIENTNGVSISDSYLANNVRNHGNGIYATTSVNDIINGCKITGSYNDIYLDSVGYSHIINTTAVKAVSAGLNMVSCNNIEISGLYSGGGGFDSSVYGIKDDGSSNIVINGTQADSNSHGIFLSGTTNSLVTRSAINDNKGDGINDGFGIELFGTSGISVYQNGFSRNALYYQNGTKKQDNDTTIRDVLIDPTATGTIWDTTSKVTYTITTTDNNGNVVSVDPETNYTGNYWGHYPANDSNNDHIADRPWVETGPNASDQTMTDNYPLLFDPMTLRYGQSILTWSGPAIPVVAPTATPVPSPLPSPSPWPSPSASPSHACSPSPAASSNPSSGGSGGYGGSSGGVWINGGTATPTPSASTNASATPGTVTPTSSASPSPTALPETPTPSATPSPTGGSATLYIVLAILAILVIAGVGAYFLTRKK